MGVGKNSAEHKFQKNSDPNSGANRVLAFQKEPSPVPAFSKIYPSPSPPTPTVLLVAAPSGGVGRPDAWDTLSSDDCGAGPSPFEHHFTARGFSRSSSIARLGAHFSCGAQ